MKRNSLPITSVIQDTKKETFIWIHFSLILSFYLLTKCVLKNVKIWFISLVLIKYLFSLK